MTNATKATIISATLITTLGAGYIGTGGGFEILEGSIMTKNQYEQVRAEVVWQYLQNKEFGNWQDFQAFVAVLDKELKGIPLDLNDEQVIEKMAKEALK